jgi:hypothetical protein
VGARQLHAECCRGLRRWTRGCDEVQGEAVGTYVTNPRNRAAVELSVSLPEPLEAGCLVTVCLTARPRALLDEDLVLVAPSSCAQ